MGAFQEIDQVAVMKPVTKWSERVYEARRIPEMIELAVRTALSGKPGPVYLDLPGDVLTAKVEDDAVVWPNASRPIERAKPFGDPKLVELAVELLAKAKRPLLLTGTGVLWSGAAEALESWVNQTGIPVFTTPQGRGVLPEDHPIIYLNARGKALRETDLIIVLGTRLNYIFNHGLPPRINADAKMIRIDIDPMEIGRSRRPDIGIVGDAGAVLSQFAEASRDRITMDTYSAWREHLAAIEQEKRPEQERAMSTDQVPIHPLRLCKEIRDFMDRDAILAVDGQEILNFGRQSIPTFVAGHRLNSGTFGTMGVGLPFGVGAKAAKPNKQVIVLHGDGSFGMNGLELDTAVRHGLPILVVISLNGGWTADPKGEKPGRNLGYTHYEEIAKVLGCHAEYVEKPADIAPALRRAGEAIKSGRSAVVNVLTDFAARASTVRFTSTST
jgi:acetolactate synthase-1/2/3 large subunit